MSDKTKYYYLKIKENFFDSEEMKLLESMDNGYLYSNILMKMYLLSLKNGGKLMYKDKIPYNSKMLSTILNHNVDILEKAIKIFQELNLIEILDSGAIFMLDIQNYIGKSSDEADRKREYRNRIEETKKIEMDKCLDISQTNCSNIKDKDKDKDKDINNNMSCKIEEIINYLNKPDTNEPIRSFRKTSNNTRSIINARLKEGFTVDDFKDVIFYKYNQWVKKPVKFQNGVMSDTYYRPETLFCSKNFENYLQEYRDKSK